MGENILAPFNEPLFPPGVAPDAAPGCTITLNAEWLPYVLGACHIFTDENMWQGDAAAKAAAVQFGNVLLSVLANYDNCEELAVMEYVQIEQQLTVNTDGGTMSNNTWHTRQLNTIVFDTTEVVTLDTYVATFPAGKWLFMGRAVGNQVNEHRARLLRDGSEVVSVGTNQRAGSTDTVASDATVFGLVVATEAFTIALQHRCTQTRVGLGFGYKANMSVPETYALLAALKIGD